MPYVCVCVCARAHVYVCVCVCARASVCVFVCARPLGDHSVLCVKLCMRAYVRVCALTCLSVRHIVRAHARVCMPCVCHMSLFVYTRTCRYTSHLEQSYVPVATLLTSNSPM